MHRLKVVFIQNISKELAQFSRSFALLFSSVRSRFSLLFAIESTVQFERGLERDKKEAQGKVDRHCYFMPKKVFPNNSYLMAYVDPFVLSFFTVLHYYTMNSANHPGNSAHFFLPICISPTLFTFTQRILFVLNLFNSLCVTAILSFSFSFVSCYNDSVMRFVTQFFSLQTIASD